MSSTSLPVWSRHHPVIPKRYVPAWTTDMKNRRLIVQNCRQANYPYGPFNTSVYLERRERLNHVEPSRMVESKRIDVSREQLLNPWIHSPLSKYRSSLMHYVS
ncbi:testis-expressed protein 43-like [Dendronephthya gigantea]|uniref:testis-expressed protein 43-like n=1 Tax=Dendronephthya gigantea TaxID=151771 RepID=UPI00106D387D|nr:testis-expressed protein 43-like [Dendronephthya gigantea]